LLDTPQADGKARQHDIAYTTLHVFIAYSNILIRVW
jgi:hypothetical protein